VKKTFLILLISAVAVWGYVVVRVAATLFGKAEAASPARERGGAPSPAAALLARGLAPLDTTFRDPFQSYLYAQKPAPAAPKAEAVRQPLKVIEPPAAELAGILWGDEPVAILKQEGKTELVKKGAEVWGLKVLKIDRHQVVVQKQGRSFTLEY
jgi:hypothetical protein